MRRVLLALPLAALLAACNATSPTSTVSAPIASQPTPQVTAGQVYEVKFQNVGTPTATSSMSRIATGLTKQALQGIDDSKLVFTPVTVNTFVLGGKRYVQAIYRVRNDTGADLQHLTFVPIDTDPDPAATTPLATAPTVGSTYFKSLMRFDGGDASGRAGDLTPITGRLYSVAAGQDVTDPDATPYTALDTSTLRPAAPAGLIIAGRASSGWRSGTTLPNGGSGTITFAVAVANSDARTDPFNFSLVVAEGDDVTPPTVTAVSPNQGSVAGGTAVTVKGSNFVSGTRVAFGSVSAASVVIDSPTSLTAVSPAATITGKVDVVLSTGGTSSALSSADQFIYVSADTPTVTGVNPNLGVYSAKTPVTITGTGFTSDTTVKFGRFSASDVVVNSSTSLTATEPLIFPPGKVDVTVSNSKGSSAVVPADQFGYLSFMEFSLPTANSAPASIVGGADGNLWFAEAFTPQVGEIVPRFDAGYLLEFPTGANSFVSYSITNGPDGNLWIGGLHAVGRVSTNGVISAFPLASGGAVHDITTGPDGNLWFTQGNGASGGRISKITPSGTVTSFDIPSRNRLSDPQGVTGGPDGNVWFTSETGDQIGRVTPDGTITGFSIPTSNGQPRGITKGTDGNLWFTEVGGNKIGRITPSGSISEFPIPTAASNPQDITSDADGNLWFTEADGNRIGRITPGGGIVEISVPTASSGPQGITIGPDGNVWFTEATGNKVGALRR